MKNYVNIYSYGGQPARISAFTSSAPTLKGPIPCSKAKGGKEKWKERKIHNTRFIPMQT